MKNGLRGKKWLKIGLAFCIFGLIGSVFPQGIVYARDVQDVSTASIQPDVVMFQSSSGGTATVLALDVSGSMDENFSNTVKIDAARAAASQVVDIVEQEASIGQNVHQMSVVPFSDDAWVEQPLSADFAGVRQAIQSLYPMDKTNIGDALTVSLDQLENAKADAHKVLILLSDGVITRGMSSDEVLAGPVTRAKRQGVCIYTVGFGNPGDLDENLLKAIASESGCGKYYYAGGLNELRSIYVRSRHESTGRIIFEKSGSITEGETVSLGNFDIGQDDGELVLSLLWPGSDMSIDLVDPSGRTVDVNYPGANIAKKPDLIHMVIQNPPVGTWGLSVRALSVPEQRMDFNAIVSARNVPRPRPTPVVLPTVAPMPPPSAGGVGFPLAIVLIILAGAGVIIYGVVVSTRKKTGGSGASLRCVQGECVGRTFPLSASIVIGRGTASGIKLMDAMVSRSHARIRLTYYGWYIQDMQSRYGTYVNGQPVKAAKLNNGDQVMIGNSVFLFLAD